MTVVRDSATQANLLRRCACALIVIGFGIVCCGCGRGLQGYDVSGTLTFQERPVPHGRLVFTPDADSEGWQSVAMVEQGLVVSDPNRGVASGPHWIQIMAFDGVPYEDGEGLQPHGRQLFPMLQTQVQMPAADSSLTVNVSGDGAIDLQVAER